MHYVLSPNEFSRNLAPGTLRRVLGGYLLACLISTAVWYITGWLAYTGLRSFAHANDIWQVLYTLRGIAFFILFLTAFFALPLTFIPALAGIVWTEVRGERRWAAHVGMGLAVAACVWLFFGSLSRVDFAGDAIFVLCLFEAGFVAGVTYWAIAGRHAGRWRIEPNVMSIQSGEN